MKYLKKLIVIFLFCVLLTSCSGKQEKYDIRVISTYPYLDGLSEGAYSTPLDTLNDSYENCRCVVSAFQGKLLITDKISYGNSVSGVSYKISFRDYWGDETGLFRQDENGDNEVITTESLVGIIPCANGEDFLAITGGIYGGKLHLIVCGEDTDEYENVALRGMPLAFSYSDAENTESGCFYIATEKHLLRVDASAYLNGDPNAKITVKEYKVPNYWTNLEINSMCLIGNMLYMGTQKGVLSFYADMERYTYYPVDYETAINGETD